MTEWHLMTEAELAQDEVAQEAKRLAYFKTFYGSSEGRAVLLDIQRLCFGNNGEQRHESLTEAAIALRLIDLLDTIKGNCGLNLAGVSQVIVAEAAAISNTNFIKKENENVG